MILVNGEATGLISVRDRGLQYGDGLFETLAVRDGEPLEWPRHLRRLAHGCRRLRLALPEQALLLAEARRVCAGVERGVLKIMLSRGEGGRGYAAAAGAAPTRVVSLHPWPEYPADWYRRGVVLYGCRHRLALQPALAGVKHLNRLDQVLARMEWDDPSIAEGVMLDLQGRVIEGTMSNLFLVRGGALYTPALDEAGVAGITRERILELAQTLGLDCHITRLVLADLVRAEELFVCNSVIGIWPVGRLAWAEAALPAPGPVTARLMRALVHPCLEGL